VIRTYVEYVCAKEASAKHRPTVQRIHPTALSGRRLAIKAPTTEKARTAGSPRDRETSSEEAAASTVTVPTIAAAAATTVDHASHAAPRAVMSTTSSRL